MMNRIKEKLFTFKFLVWTGITFMVIALVSPVVLAPLIHWAVSKLHGDIEKLGQTGDLLGGSTVPFFNIASIFLILATIAIQKEELKQTREEFKEQNNTLSIQRFENTFFQMVNLHNNLVSSLRIEVNHHKKPTGKAVISYALGELKRIYNADELAFRYGPIDDLKSQTKLIKQSYKNLYRRHDNEIGNELENYYRNLYHIIKFIDESNIENKITYIRIIRAQLSTDELILLLYNGLSEYGSTKVLTLLNRYDFLHNIKDRTDLMLSKHDYEIYLSYENYIKER